MFYNPDGKTVIITAPSGAGKTTVVKHLLGIEDLNLEFSISACTRPPREGEVHGRDYYFMSTDSFKNKIEEDEFVEWEEVYKNSFYGTLKTEVRRIWRSNRNILFDVDVMGGISLKQKFGERAFALFIMPPSLDVLRNRLKIRGLDSPVVIENRINKASLEIRYAGRFDATLVNDMLDETLKQAEKLVRCFLENPVRS
ncbi:MAG: guanylate kinase [Bacteroidales bacterium]|nr:guanylate kinase [Bacteroidales bacterium]